MQKIVWTEGASGDLHILAFQPTWEVEKSYESCLEDFNVTTIQL